MGEGGKCGGGGTSWKTERYCALTGSQERFEVRAFELAPDWNLLSSVSFLILFLQSRHNIESGDRVRRQRGILLLSSCCLAVM